jgi:hypothetical protein
MMVRAKLLGVALSALLLWACATPRPLEVNTPQGQEESYPPAIAASAARLQAAEEAWAFFLAEHRLPEAKPEFEPVLYTPRALPASLANRINLKPAAGAFGEAEAKKALRQFIERWQAMLGGADRRGSPQAKDTSLIKDLSLVSFSDEGNIYRAVYQQMSYPFPLAEGYGELRLVVSKAGGLLQLSSRLVPVLDLPSRAAIEPQTIPDKFLGREFSYTSIAGRPLSYKVTGRAEIILKDLVIYPKLEKDKLFFHLAYPVETGRGTTWTVYVDAVTGGEIAVKQNFAS